jgi:uncharacterized membrane protein (GlpM family)
MLYVLKVFLSAVVIVGVTELSKRANSFWAGVLASLPLVSLLAFIWLYVETKDNDKIISLSWSIFWLVIPSLSLFATLPMLLKRGLNFPLALGLAMLVMIAAYLVTAAVLRRFGVNI